MAQVTLTWSAPSSNGGAAITRYHVRCTLMIDNTPFTGPEEPAPCRGGVELATPGAGSTSTQLTVSRIQAGPYTWLRWEIAAENSAGIGPYATASVLVPDIRGRDSFDAYTIARAVGLKAGGGRKSCSGNVDSICDHSPAPGSFVSNGTSITLYQPQ